MDKKLITITLLFLLIRISSGQPEVAWWRSYDAGGVRNESLWDLYRVSNGGYVACGSSDYRIWVLRINDNGNLIWSSIFDDGTAYSIVETDEGNFVTGCSIKNDIEQSQFGAILINPDGEQIWSNAYCLGVCHAVIELKSGEFLVSGNANEGHIRMIEPDG